MGVRQGVKNKFQNYWISLGYRAIDYLRPTDAFFKLAAHRCQIGALNCLEEFIAGSTITGPLRETVLRHISRRHNDRYPPAAADRAREQVKNP